MYPRLLLPATLAVFLPLQAIAAPVIFSGTADDAAGLTPIVEEFREALGPKNDNTPVNANRRGHRSINWDAAPDAISDPNPFPGDFFNADVAPRARGIEFQANGDTTGFLLSATEASGQKPAFGFEDFFPTFSPERLFSPVGGTTFDVLFFNPADPEEKATTRGLGVVFSGLTFDYTASMSFYDAEDNLLAKEFAKSSKGGKGLSFLGLIFDNPIVSRVSFDGGSRFLDKNGDFDGPSGDAFVMDDFIFGEPIPESLAAVPLPAPIALLGMGLLSLGLLRRTSGQPV